MTSVLKPLRATPGGELPQVSASARTVVEIGYEGEHIPVLAIGHRSRDMGSGGKEGSILQLEKIMEGPTRFILPVAKGFIKGKDVDAEILGGGDYSLLNPKTNVLHLDVRTQARTSTGSSIYIQYQGRLKLDEATLKAMSWSPDAKTTDFGDHEWFTTPAFETDDEQLKWIEEQVWVGQGRLIVEEGETAVEYGIHQILN